MNNRDFIRQSPRAESGNRSVSVWRFVHTDPPLLVGLILICFFGLFVLYSASDGNEGVVRRQALVMVVGIV
ncbi:MAG: rod shape-determining protein RodA, partial [Gammaproteobacteria bacterium]|nr:rod shape-determining protein RodA [Gammaproteobacteria bacterium]